MLDMKLYDLNYKNEIGLKFLAKMILLINKYKYFVYINYNLYKCFTSYMRGILINCHYVLFFLALFLFLFFCKEFFLENFYKYIK